MLIKRSKFSIVLNMEHVAYRLNNYTHHLLCREKIVDLQEGTAKLGITFGEDDKEEKMIERTRENREF